MRYTITAFVYKDFHSIEYAETLTKAINIRDLMINEFENELMILDYEIIIAEIFSSKTKEIK